MWMTRLAFRETDRTLILMDTLIFISVLDFLIIMTINSNVNFKCATKRTNTASI